MYRCRRLRTKISTLAQQVDCIFSSKRPTDVLEAKIVVYSDHSQLGACPLVMCERNWDGLLCPVLALSWHPTSLTHVFPPSADNKLQTYPVINTRFC